MHNTPWTDYGSTEPSPIFPYRPLPKATKRSPGLHRKSHTRELTDAMARHRSLQPIARIIVAVAPFMCMVATAALFESSAAAHGHFFSVAGRPSVFPLMDLTGKERSETIWSSRHQSAE